MKAFGLLLASLLFAVLLCSAQEGHTYVGHYLDKFSGSQVYRDAQSGTIFYVESDGRHVAAISSKGKLLWNRDPFTDAKLPLYRTATPKIVFIGAAQESAQVGKREGKKFIAISFNSTQFGLLRISDGEFTFLGQD